VEDEGPDEPAYDLEPSVLGTPPDLSFMIEEVPSRSSSSLIIHHRLGSESHYQAVLKLVEEYLPKFDIYNCATALHKFGLNSRDDELATRQIQSDPNFIRLFSATKKRALEIETVAKVEPRVLSSILWACARLNIYDSELTKAVAEDAQSRMNQYSPQQIGMIMWALGYSGVRPRPSFIKAMITELQGRPDFDSHTCMMITYSCMRLGIRDKRVMEAVGRVIIDSNLEDAEPLEVASYCYAYGKLEYWEKGAFSVIADRVLDTMGDFSPRMFSMSALGLAAAAAVLEGFDETMDKLKVMIEDRLVDFDHRDLSTIAFAVGRFSKNTQDRRIAVEGLEVSSDWTSASADEKENPLVRALKDEVIRRDLESFTMQELNLITYSLMRMENRDAAFLEIAARLFAENAAELMEVEILNILYCYAKCNYLNIALVHRMVQELIRRNSFESFEPLHWAILCYSLAFNKVRHEEVMARAALVLCERAREFSPQQISMIMWSMAVLNCRNHAEVLSSAVAEELTKKPATTTPSLIICLWSCAILAGPAAALHTMKLLLSDDFWDRELNQQHYTMVYYLMASWKAELGLSVESLLGHTVCRRCYEEATALYMGEQHRRLSDRLRVQQIPHQANAMAPILDGFGESGVRVDVAINKLKLVIEVEGPQRNTIPLELLTEKLIEEDQLRSFSSGDRIDVLGQAREFVECGLNGPAAFKRRLLRLCGWRVVTISFDESEEYIADALKKMMKKGQGDDQATPAPVSDSFPESAAYDSIQDFDPMSIEKPDPSNISDFEVQLRALHADAMRKLRIQLFEERGDVASAGSYANFLEYRQWQVGVEKQILAELVASIQAEVPA